MRRILRITYLCIGLVSVSLGTNDRYNSMLFSNNYTEVRKGISLGADVEARLRGSTPLYDAARKGNIEIVGLLIERGADVNAVCHGETALLKVVALGDTRMAKELIRKGAEVNVADEHLGNTPLHYAVLKKNTAMINLLLSNGADMYAENKRGDTPARVVLANRTMPAVSIENGDIKLRANTFNLGKGSVSLNINNKTDDFITITYVALYIDGDLVSEASMSKKLAPRVGASVGTLNVPQETYEGAKIRKSGLASVKYGFAVEYDVGGKSRSLYKNTKTEFQLW
ncbi:ankyrin repeat domain-containing protein [uncultured Helicobacter sp.]|uniref:ankyrin repeat domain-containing protein n=1 Tax=uncultured Helicobacter sp. TaxID=175537 RepID=UPI00374E6B19